MGPGMGSGSPGMSRPMGPGSGPPGLLGMSPNNESMTPVVAGPNQPPPPPTTSHLTEQIGPLTALVETQRDQIAQSGSNLSGQWEVLQQTQDNKIEEAVSAAQEEAL